MRTLSLVLLTGLAVLSSLHGEPAAPPIPAEMKALDRFLGTWTEMGFVSKVAEWTPQEVRSKGAVAVTRIILGGRCLADDSVSSDDGAMHHGVWSWNAEEKAYHFTYFGSAGDRLEVTGHWDEAAQTMTTTAPMPNGVTMRGTIHFPDANTKEWHAVATDAAGKVYLDMTAKQTRGDKK
jgi:hypothetical protein